MIKKADYNIRSAKDRMLKQVNEIMARYRFVDNAAWTLSEDKKKIDEAIAKYYQILKKPIVGFFAHDQLMDSVKLAQQQFIDGMKGNLNKSMLETIKKTNEKLIQGTRDTIIKNIDQMLIEGQNNLQTRAMDFKASAEMAYYQEGLSWEALSIAERATGTLAEAAEAQTEYIGLKQRSIAARTAATAENVEKIWDDMLDKYGSTETVKYRNGANQPLNTYLDGRATTSAMEANLLTSQADAAALNIYTGKISNHQSKDTCNLWEGKLVFYSDAARYAMIIKYPELANTPTIDELRKDKTTHLLKFNCSHTVTPFPLHLMDEADAKAEIRSAA